MKPYGTAWSIDSTLPLAKQVELVLSWQHDGKLLRDERTKPRLAAGPHGWHSMVEWSTHAFQLVQPLSLLCYQALMEAMMACDLETAGVVKIQVPDSLHLTKDFQLAGANFGEVNSILDLASACGSAFHLGHPVVRIDNVLDVFTRKFGTFAIHAWHYHIDDIEHEEVGIPHYLLYNATTRLLQCYPEVRAY
jgi:hypothetical protein